MKLESPENPVQVISKGQVKNHTMRLTAETRRKIFNMLSKPYSNPIAAVIRELSTNASDEHIKYGIDKPFDVHLPSATRLWFTIRDYAEGLSPEGMEDYCSYTHSDKIHSNDFNGCLGIGSKSPFAYTDGYSIVSRHNGVKYAYNLFIDEDGIPSHTLVGEEPTDEPSGLEIQIPIRREDLSSFHNNASKIYEWFDDEPNFVGTPFEIIRTKTTIKKDHFSLASEFEGHGITMVMGQVAYNFPIDYSDFPEDFTDYNKIGLILFIENGKLEFEPGRERISKTRKNLNTIREALIKVRDEMSETFREEISQCESYFHAMMKYYELRRHQLYSTLFGSGSGNSPLEYNGEPLRIGLDIPRVGLEMYDTHDRKKVLSLNPANNLLFIIDDSKIGGFAQFKRIDEHHSFPSYKNLHFIRGEEEKIEEFIKTNAIPSDMITYISEYPKYLEKVVRTVPLSDDIMVYYKHGYSPKRLWEKDPNFDFADGGYYISFNNYGYNKTDANGDTHRRDAVELRKYVETIRLKEGGDIKLVGVKKAVLKDFIESPDWTDIIEAVDSLEFSDEMNEHVSFLLLADKFKHTSYIFNNPFSDYNYMSQFCGYAYDNIDTGKIKLDDFSDDLQYLITKYNEIASDDNLVAYYENVFKCKNMSMFSDVTDIAYTDELLELCKRIDEQYPLFRHVEYSGYDYNDNLSTIQKLIDYFNFLN